MNSSAPYYHPLEFQITTTVVFSTFACIGLIGNLMVILVVLRIPGMKTPTNCYLVSLASSDCLFFIATLPTELTSLYLPQQLYIFGAIACPITRYIPYLCINASSLSIAAFTIERYIGICHPLMAKYVCTVRRAAMIITFIWIFSFAYNSPWLVFVSLTPVNITGIPGAHKCTFSQNRNELIYKIMYMSDIFVFYFLPLALCLLLYGRIGSILLSADFAKDYRRSVKLPIKIQLNDRSLLLSVRRYSTNSTVTALAEKNEINRRVASNNLTKSRIQVVKMLAVVVSVFALAWLPYRGLMLYNSFASKRYVDKWYILFAKSCIFANGAANPILYSVLSQKFRAGFRLFCGYCSSRMERTDTGRINYSTMAQSRFVKVPDMSISDNFASTSSPPNHIVVQNNTMETAVDISK